jgi:hypothetical protein
MTRILAAALSRTDLCCHSRQRSAASPGDEKAERGEDERVPRRRGARGGGLRAGRGSRARERSGARRMRRCRAARRQRATRSEHVETGDVPPRHARQPAACQRAGMRGGATAKRAAAPRGRARSSLAGSVPSCARGEASPKRAASSPEGQGGLLCCCQRGEAEGCHGPGSTSGRRPVCSAERVTCRGAHAFSRARSTSLPSPRLLKPAPAAFTAPTSSPPPHHTTSHRHHPHLLSWTASSTRPSSSPSRTRART